MLGLVNRGGVGAQHYWVSSAWVDKARLPVAKSSQASLEVGFGGRSRKKRGEDVSCARDVLL